MPASSSERAHLVRLLSDLARRSPNWEVLIKPRIAPGDATFHDVETHISTTLKRDPGGAPGQSAAGLPPPAGAAEAGPGAGHSLLNGLLRRPRLRLPSDCHQRSRPAAGLRRPRLCRQRRVALPWRPSPIWMPSMPKGPPRIRAGWSGWGTERSSAPPPCSTPCMHSDSTSHNPSPAASATRAMPNPASISCAWGPKPPSPTGDWSSARELLCQATLMRPLHRGVARRHWAVRQTQPLLRQIALLISYRDLK